ncbi:hypothetical protein [Streptomyces sp. NPDC058735]|uniref:hypothetical protein n=1 Tax=unclassified Streptomyces TaxID=2593676 RepID=UPI0036A1C39C
MHRTTTTAALLVTVAVSALSGCTTVRHPPVAGPSAAASRPSAPLPEGQAEAEIEQAPAREALQLIEGSRRPEPNASASRPASPPHAAAPDRGRPPSETGGVRARPGRPERPAPAPRGPERRGTDPAEVPESVRQEVRRRVPDASGVCALGRRHGGWRPDSPEARICGDTYGR